MCGRFTLRTRLVGIVEGFGVDEVGEGFIKDSASYNIAPSRQVAVVTKEDGLRRLSRARWGLTPKWDAQKGKLLFNARAETVAEKPAFKKAFMSGRCIIVADGFYEWKRGGTRPALSQKVPYYFQLASEGVFGFAGLMEGGEDGAGHECAIITTTANPLVGEVHTRMPVILMPEAYLPWLNKGSGRDELIALLSPLDPALMRGYEVGAAVNSAAHDSPENISPVAA